MSRPLLVVATTAATTAALAGAFLAGSRFADTPATDSDERPPAVDQTLAAAPVSFADSCDDLLATYVDRGTELVGPWGWDQGYDLLRSDAQMYSDGAAKAPIASAAAPVSQRATSGDSGTNVQEAGVDEPDVVKTDGELLVRIDAGVLTTYDVTGGDEPTELGRLVLERARYGELLLSGDTLTVVAAQDDATTRVLTVDLAEPTAPTVTATSDLDGRLLGARLHGTTVRVVVAAGLPDLRFVHPGRQRTEQEATRANADLVRATTIDDWLPGPLLDCADVAVPEEAGGLDTVAVVGFDAADPDDLTTQGVLATADVAYFSPDHLYLAAAHGAGWWGCCATTTRPYGPVDDALTGTTTLHDLALDGTGTTYLASGRVDGSVADRWAMDEYDGVLRVAVGPTGLTGDFNSVVTLEQDGPALVEIGRVDELGPRERIESVRWFDGLAIVVTFRQTDPLYAVDLTDPAAPTLMGELKIPGFSEYLHPLGSMRMIGVGQGPGEGGRGWGAQVGLFDVTDLTDPRRLDVLTYARGTRALAGLDPRQLTWLPDSRTVLTVVTRGRTGWVSAIHLDDGTMSNRMVEVEQGSDVSEVRTVPLPDGRVVLVTGTAVSYFAL